MKPVFIAASPNAEFDDVLLALKQLMLPWNWFNKSKTRKLEEKVAHYLGVKHVFAFDSARSSFYLLMKAYGIAYGDEVILPSFTCLVIANPVIWCGATPVYVDVDENFNLDLADLKHKLTKNTKAILIQHTFGLPVEIEKVKKIVGDKVKLIEDTAHAFGGVYRGQKIGSIGDAAVITFGIEKVISCVRGGMVAVNDDVIAERIRKEQRKAKRFSLPRLIISLLNPLWWKAITPFYYLGFGKFTLGRMFVLIGHKFNLLGNMIENEEYMSKKPSWLPATLPGALSTLALKQLTKLERYNQHRIRIAEIYARELDLEYPEFSNSKNIFLRFPVLVKDRARVFSLARKNRVVLGDWYREILYSPRANWHYFKYKQGTAPLAEKLSESIINLPTGINVSEQQARSIAALVKPYLIKNGNKAAD